MAHNSFIFFFAVITFKDPPSPRDWCDFYEDMVDAELEEDEAIEDYYYSSAAGACLFVCVCAVWGQRAVVARSWV